MERDSVLFVRREKKTLESRQAILTQFRAFFDRLSTYFEADSIDRRTARDKNKWQRRQSNIGSHKQLFRFGSQK